MLLGIIIVIIGFSCLLENLGISINWGILVSLLLILSCFYLILRDKKITFWSIILFIIGMWNLLLNLNVVTLEFSGILWPILLVLTGISIIFNKLKLKNIRRNEKENKTLVFNGIFSGCVEKIINEDVQEIKVRAIFGGVELDLTNLKITENLNIHVYSIFGGVDLLLSDDYNIVVSSTSIFGGVENKHNSKEEKNKKNININIINIFGGTDLK